MNDRKKHVDATQSTKSRVDAGTKVVEHVKNYLQTRDENHNVISPNQLFQSDGAFAFSLKE